MGRGSDLGRASLAVSSSLGRCTKSFHFGIVDHVQYSIHHGAYGVVDDMFYRECLDATIDTPGFPSSSIPNHEESYHPDDRASARRIVRSSIDQSHP